MNGDVYVFGSPSLYIRIPYTAPPTREHDDGDDDDDDDDDDESDESNKSIHSLYWLSSGRIVSISHSHTLRIWSCVTTATASYALLHTSTLPLTGALSSTCISRDADHRYLYLGSRKGTSHSHARATINTNHDTLLLLHSHMSMSICVCM